MTRAEFAEAQRWYAPLYRCGAQVTDPILAHLDQLFAAPSEPPPPDEDEPAPSTLPVPRLPFGPQTTGAKPDATD